MDSIGPYVSPSVGPQILVFFWKFSFQALGLDKRPGVFARMSLGTYSFVFWGCLVWWEVERGEMGGIKKKSSSN